MTYIGAFYYVEGLSHVSGSGRLSFRKLRIAGCCMLGHKGSHSTGQIGVCDHGKHVGTIFLLRRHYTASAKTHSKTSTSKPEAVITMSVS